MLKNFHYDVFVWLDWIQGIFSQVPWHLGNRTTYNSKTMVMELRWIKSMYYFLVSVSNRKIVLLVYFFLILFIHWYFIFRISTKCIVYGYVATRKVSYETIKFSKNRVKGGGVSYFNI